MNRKEVLFALHQVLWIDIDGEEEILFPEPVHDLFPHLPDEERGEFSFGKLEKDVVAETASQFGDACRRRAENSGFFRRKMEPQGFTASIRTGFCGTFVR